MHLCFFAVDTLEAQHLTTDEDHHAVAEIDRRVGLAKHAVQRVDRQDLHAAVGGALEQRVLAREEAIVVERDVRAVATDDEVLAGERIALPVGAVTVTLTRVASSLSTWT